MRITKSIVTLVLLGLFHFAVLSSAKGVSSYIYSPERSQPVNLLKELPDVNVYTDNELQHLILHNLNLADVNEVLPESTQALVREHGNKNLIKSQKLNFAFLLEANQFSGLVGTEKGSKSPHRHRSASFNVCNNGESSECVLNHLYDRNNQKSVIRRLIAHSRKENPEAYFYSSNPNVGGQFERATLRNGADNQGGLYILDQNSNSQFKVANNLNACVNSILEGEYVVDLEGGHILSNEVPVFTANENNREALTNYLTDICSIVGVSSLVRKDANPSFLTFHVDSLQNLEKNLSEKENKVLYQIFNVAYQRFLKNLLSQYSTEELSGQVLILSPQNNINASGNQEILIELPSGLHKPRGRILAEVPAAASSTDGTTKIIFGGTLIVFVIVTAWVCIELFNMDIQKDSVVYAKFLAADYFKR